jgi:hypothetical protein
MIPSLLYKFSWIVGHKVDLVHSIEQELLARAQGTEVEAKICLFFVLTQ